MYCSKCGSQIDKKDKFCIFCGNPIENDKNELLVDNNQKQTNGNNQNVETGPWRGFAKAGYVLGIVTLCACIIPWISFSTCVPGIVLSALGRRSPSLNDKAQTGLIMSIVGTVLSIVLLIAFYAIIFYIASTKQ